MASRLVNGVPVMTWEESAVRLSETTKSRRAGGTGGDGRHGPNTKQTRDDDNVSISEVPALRTREDVPRKVREMGLVPLHAEAM
jgi:hypothetical protein